MATTKDTPNLQLDFVEIVNPRLWMSPTYNNAYVGNVAPTLALDVTAPLSGWYDCGTIKAAKMPVTKTMRELKRGTPQTSRKFWETDRTAMLNFNTADLTPYVEALMSGQTVRNTLSATPSVTVKNSQVKTPGALPRSTMTIKGSPIYTQYMVVVCASPTAASLQTSFNMAVVESLTASILTLEGAGFPIAAVGGDRIIKIKRTAFMDRMGVQTVRSAMLFWDTIINSSGSVKAQHCVYFPKVRNFTGQDIDFKDETEEYEAGISLAAQSVFMTFDDGTTGYDFYKKWVLSY